MFRFKMGAVAATVLTTVALGAVAPAHAAPATPAPSQAKPAPASYVPAQADFVGKWKLYGAAVRAPSDLPAPATAEQSAEARSRLRTLMTFYQAFDYLEISADGRFNFHQPGEKPGDACAWCGNWTFHDESLWFDLPMAPRLDIYAKIGSMQMTYDTEISDTSMFRWLAVGWNKVR